MAKYEILYIIRPNIEEAKTLLVARFDSILTDNEIATVGEESRWEKCVDACMQSKISVRTLPHRNVEANDAGS